jgi:hypothetical protein
MWSENAGKSLGVIWGKWEKKADFDGLDGHINNPNERQFP